MTINVRARRTLAVAALPWFLATIASAQSGLSTTIAPLGSLPFASLVCYIYALTMLGTTCQ
jgi:hypothetical protein